MQANTSGYKNFNKSLIIQSYNFTHSLLTVKFKSSVAFNLSARPKFVNFIKSLFEELGGKYERQGDYLIPCLTVPAEEEQAIGIWGQRHLDYLKQYRKVTYTNLLTSGRLNAYLADINRQAQERFERLIEGMKQAQGITEQLKAENALEWTGCLNNIRACAREIVEKEIIFA